MREFLARGLRVLVVEPTGQLLRESSRALENRVGRAEASAAAGEGWSRWLEWLAGLERSGAVRNGCLDGAFAEIALSREWLEAQEAGKLRVLFYATPVAVEWSGGPGEADPGGRIGAVVLGTKAGLRRVCATSWLDASEEGVLVRLCREERLTAGAGKPAPHARAGETGGRQPVACYHGVALQSRAWARYEEPVRRFCEARSVTLAESARASERRLFWRTGNGTTAGGGWHREVARLLAALRAAVPMGTEVVVSHCGMEPFPVWQNGSGGCPGGVTGDRTGGVAVIRNAGVASPAFREVAAASIGERFAWGVQCARELAAMTGEHGGVSDRSVAAARMAMADGSGEGIVPVRTIVCDVLVAGAGTAGALAAIAAAREGAKVCALDLATFPGGTGTGAAISGYFHGLEGGLQEETDRLTAEMNVLLEGERGPSRRWHHDGKKIALLMCFEKYGVGFLGGTLLCGAERDAAGRVSAVVAATSGGLVRFEATAFVDSTGDGDLCALAGAEFFCGRPGDGRAVAFTQAALVLKNVGNEGSSGGESDGGKPEVVARNFDAGWTDATDIEALSQARLLGVAQHWREEWTAADRPLAMAALPGIRQSRNIITDYTLTLADLVAHERFPDAICKVGAVADTHSVDFEFEEDEAVFYFWACRLFRHPLETSLPYRVMLPRGLANVWIACRAAGMDATASYAVRMQRDMQRLGEVAGVAAARAARTGAGCGSREVDVAALQAQPGCKGSGKRTGSIGGNGDDARSGDEITPAEAAALLAAGAPGLYLWRIFRHPEAHRSLVETALESANADTSFYAATILAMWGDASAEPRLLAAIEQREEGPPPSPGNTGAYGQEIDIPFWLLAVVLLRRCGTFRCAATLRDLAANRDAILNVRTAIALTVERLASGNKITPAEALEMAGLLLAHPAPDRMLAPSRSIWRALRAEPQLRLRNDCGVDTRQDHLWQVHLVASRIRERAINEAGAAQRHFRDRVSSTGVH